MADVISVDEFEDWSDDNNKNEVGEINCIITEVAELSEPQTLLNDSSEETTKEPEKDPSDMTLKSGASEPELFASEDLVVNPTDLLPPVERLEKYANSDLAFNRQVVACKLLETLRIVHEDTDEVERVVNVLCSISEDYDPTVRSELMVQLPHIAAFCKEVKLNNTIVQYLVPMLISYLGDESNLVRRSSHAALLSIIEQGLLDFDIVSEKICPLILHLTDSVHPEDIRTESISLMSKLVVLMGKKAAEDIFFERLFDLFTDQVNNVRKACALTFGDICTTVGKETTEEVLLPKFFVLCEDSAWCVRKACAENFMPVSCVVSRETRCKELANLYLILLSDQSRWVRLTAYQALGPFISTFAEPDRTGLYYSKDGVLTVVDSLCSMVQDELASDDVIKCNGDVDRPVPSEDNSSLDRTNSSVTCDSVVPLCSTDTNHSASGVPGISCHVGNCCTVIEANPSTMTSATETVDGTKPNSSSLCDSKLESSGDTWTDSSKEEDRASDTENNFNNSLTDKQKEFNKMWFEAIYGCDPPTNGAWDGEPNGGESAGDSDSLVHKIELEDACALFKEMYLKSSEVNSVGPVNGEVVTCSNSMEESTGDTNEQPSSRSTENCSSRHSTDDSCTGTETGNLTAQESNNAMNCSLEKDSEESVKLKVSCSAEPSGSESAFNHFQYWRDPLPDIDIDASFQSLTNSSEDASPPCTSSFYSASNADSAESKPKAIRLWNASSGSVLHKKALVKELVQEKKGEPPPTKLHSPYDQDIVPPELLLQYLSMIDSSWAQTIDVEIARHCAYSLPAVALTLGRQFWPCLKETFDALSSDLQGFIMMWKVRRTVASAMHQLAVILGPDITSRDLLPVFSRFIHDLDEVRVGILQHLYDFLKVLRPEERGRFLPSLPEFLVSNSDSDANEKNWRFRLILAEQLVSISELYAPKQVRAHLMPLSLTLIKDKVCEVRLAAVRVIASVMKRLSQSPTTAHTKSLLTELTENFVHSPKWLHRQLYVYVCQEFIMENSLSPDQFAEDALPQLLYLCWDRVPNVRIAIARCLVVVIWPLDIFSNPTSPHRELLLQTIHTLQSDMDADVRYYANMVSTHECSCLQNGDFTNVVEPFV